MVSEQFDSGRMINQFDDLEECEDLEYVEEKLVKTQEHCDSINKTMQKIMKMLDKMSESIEELGKRTLKRTIRSDSVEKDNPDLYSKPDQVQKEKSRGDTKRIQSILNFKREDEEENDKELQREITGERSSDHLFKNDEKNWTKIAIDIKPDREEKCSQLTNLNPQSDHNPDLKLHPIPDPRMNTISDQSPDRYLNTNPNRNPNPDLYSNPDPNPNLDPYPESVPNLNLKLESRSKSEIAMDVESIEGEHSVDENVEEKKKKDESCSDSFGIWSNSDVGGESVEESPRLRRSLQSPPLLPSPSSPLLNIQPLPMLLPSYAIPTTYGLEEGIIGRIQSRKDRAGLSSKPNSIILLESKSNQINSIWARYNHFFSIQPKIMIELNCPLKSTTDYITTTRNRDWLGNFHRKLPPPQLPPPPLLHPPLVDKFHGLKPTSRQFSTTKVWLGDDHQKPLPPPLPPPALVDKMLLNRCFHFFPP